MKKASLTLIFLLSLFLLAGCESTGSASGKSASCRSSGASGSCTVTIRSMEGTISHAIENNSFRSNHDQAEVSAVVSVETGSIEVYLADGDGNETRVAVQEGQTAEIKGMADISGTNPRRFRIYFDALDGSAENIRAEVNYQGQ